jgi:hypothetical protein
MSESIVVHFPFPIGEQASGTSVRPRAMIEAFRGLGYDVWLMEGPWLRRKEKLAEIAAAVRRGHRFSFVYSETYTLPPIFSEDDHLPRFPDVDTALFRLAAAEKIPLGVFYRDVYWRFPFYRERIGWLKATAARLGFRRELRTLDRFADRIFVPSEAMSAWLPRALERRLAPLPPGHAGRRTGIGPAPRSAAELRFLYVGGVTPPNYDVAPLLQLAERHPVTLCCRREEWEARRPALPRLPPKLAVKHAQGAELEGLFREHNVFALLRTPHVYLDFAMPLKLFEALGYGMPILTNGETEAARFVRQQRVGWVIDDVGSIDAGTLVREFAEVAARAEQVSPLHSWTSRAEQAAQALRGNT